MVTGSPHVRAYAATPLSGPEGRLGILLLLNPEPVRLTAAEQGSFERIGRRVVVHLQSAVSATRAEAALRTAERAHAALAADARRYRTLVEQTDRLLCTHTLSGTIRSINEAACRALGPSLAHGIDISDRIRGEGLNRRMGRVIESSPDFVAFFDRDGQPTYMNRAARTMCGLPPDMAVPGAPLEAVVGGLEAARDLPDRMDCARVAAAATALIPTSAIATGR